MIERVEYGSHVIEYALEHRDRGSLEITVAPDGSVRVVAPLDADGEAVSIRVLKRARWIIAQQVSFAGFNPRTPARRYVPGETHLYLGRQYRIRVLPRESLRAAGFGPWDEVGPTVKMVRGFIQVTGVDFHDSRAIEKNVTDWFLKRARHHLPCRIEVNRARFPDPEAVVPTGLRLQKMPTRWGSMSPNGRLLLNPDLIRAPMDCIDYVITHELCHALVPSHGREFHTLQEFVMPDWRPRKARLEKIMA